MASESVAPESAVPHMRMVDSQGSRNGMTYVVANGEVIENLGQNNCVAVARGGSSEQRLAFQMCQVHRPLLSVSKLLTVGKAVVFHPKRSYLEDLHSGERIDLFRREGLLEIH